MHDNVVVKTPPMQPITGSAYDNIIWKGRVRITAFGRFYESYDVNEDWTFSNLRTPEDVRNKNSSLSRHLPRIGKQLGLRELLVPSPDFSARICWERELSVRIPMGRLAVRRGVNADGCRLQPGQAYGLSAAGCAAVIACYPLDPRSDEKVRIAVAHAGLRSLIDEQEAQTGLPSRHPQSVIENLFASLGASGERKYRRKRAGVVVVLPIASSEYTHPWNEPTWGEANKKRCEYIRERFGKGCLPGDEKEGRIELHELITTQCLNMGVPIQNISLICTKDVFWNVAVPNKGELWYSTRGRFPTLRNLIVIKHQRVVAPPPK